MIVREGLKKSMEISIKGGGQTRSAFFFVSSIHPDMRSKQNGWGDADDELHLTDIGKTMGLQVFVDQHSNRVSAGSVSATSK